MNETLYSWTFKFHKVVRQQNSGAVEDFIFPYFAVYLRIQKWKNNWNRSTFAKVIVKIKVAPFYGPRCSCTTMRCSVKCAISARAEKYVLTRCLSAVVELLVFLVLFTDREQVNHWPASSLFSCCQLRDKSQILNVWIYRMSRRWRTSKSWFKSDPRPVQ